jgi:hypothetical protein
MEDHQPLPTTTRMTNKIYCLSEVFELVKIGHLNLKNKCIVSTPGLIIRTCRFLPNHLTPDNFDKLFPEDKTKNIILEMNFEHL